MKKRSTVTPFPLERRHVEPTLLAKSKARSIRREMASAGFPCLFGPE